MRIRKSSLLVAAALVLSLLFNSVVYACSKLAPLGMALQSSSMETMDGMNGGAVERDPCARHEQDICKFVRNRMLSIQPSPSKAGDYQQPILLLLPLNLAIDIPKHISSSSASVAWEIAFHSVFKLPLPLAFSVLRI